MVKFINETDCVEVVPPVRSIMVWVSGQLDLKLVARLSRAIRKREEPGDDWIEHDIRVIYKSGWHSNE